MIFFNLFANCVLTKGMNRSVITDIQNKQIFFIDNEIHDLICDLETTPIEEVLNAYDQNARKIAGDCLDFLMKENLGFYCNNYTEFPKIEEDFFSPEQVNNCIIDYDENSNFGFKKIMDELSSLQCKFLQIRAYSELSLSVLFEIAHSASQGYFRSIDLILKYKNDEKYLSDFEKMYRQISLFGKVVFHSSPENRTSTDLSLDINYTKKVLSDEKCCGVINSSNFSIDIRTYIESKRHNSCLNLKISIDKAGFIRNCPSMPEHFGNILNTTLEEALSHQEFKKYWNVNREQINTCKDCEFRRICSDCRAYTERTDFDGAIDLSKPLKCGYNPYTNEWSEWSINPLKEKAIEFYKMNEFKKKT